MIDIENKQSQIKRTKTLSTSIDIVIFMKDKLYHYRAKVASVYDGDTIRVDIDLGLKSWIKDEKIRLNRINAPELRGDERPEGIKSRYLILNSYITFREFRFCIT